MNQEKHTPNERLIGALRMLERDANNLETSLHELRQNEPFGFGESTLKTDECICEAIRKSAEIGLLLRRAYGWEITSAKG